MRDKPLVSSKAIACLVSGKISYVQHGVCMDGRHLENKIDFNSNTETTIIVKFSNKVD